MEPESQPRPLVAFVEDEPAIRELARRVLEHQGYPVLLGSDGFDAVTLRFAEPEPDAMLVNGAMPGMTGPDAMRSIRERERAEGRRHMPIALETAWGHHAEIAEECGADRSICKPFTADALLGIVRQLLGSE